MNIIYIGLIFFILSTGLLISHILSIKLYNKICIPSNISEFALSYITVGSYPCQILQYIFNKTSELYNTLFNTLYISIGTLFYNLSTKVYNISKGKNNIIKSNRINKII